MITRLYKYMRLRKDFFKNRLIRATGRLALNDPFEASPSAHYFADICMQTSHTRFGDTREKIIEYIRGVDRTSAWAQLGMDQFYQHGIVSLTECPDNLLMWSHYGDEHRGMVVEFDIQNEFFVEKYKIADFPFVGTVERVLYRKQRIRNFVSFMEPYFHKSDEWMYEKEHRLLLPMHKADCRLIQNRVLEDLENSGRLQNVKSAYFSDNLKSIESCSFQGDLIKIPDVMFMFEVPPQAITAVIFGGAVTESQRIDICKTIDSVSELSHVKKLKAEISTENYEVECKEI